VLKRRKRIRDIGLKTLLVEEVLRLLLEKQVVRQAEKQVLKRLLRLLRLQHLKLVVRQAEKQVVRLEVQNSNSKRLA
jgi:hypothetical protein